MLYFHVAFGAIVASVYWGRYDWPLVFLGIVLLFDLTPAARAFWRWVFRK